MRPIGCVRGVANGFVPSSLSIRFFGELQNGSLAVAISRNPNTGDAAADILGAVIDITLSVYSASHRACEYAMPKSIHSQEIDATRSRKMFCPESPDGTTPKVPNDIPTIQPPSVWYTPPTGDRPFEFTLRVLIIINTRSLRRLVRLND